MLATAGKCNNWHILFCLANMSKLLIFYTFAHVANVTKPFISNNFVGGGKLDQTLNIGKFCLERQIWSKSGAIIGDGDRKRAPFQVLGLSSWYGTIILFLEQIAPSPAAHARTCCEDFSDVARGKSRPKFLECFMFLPQLNAFTSVCLSIFVVSCSSWSEVRPCRI